MFQRYLVTGETVVLRRQAGLGRVQVELQGVAYQAIPHMKHWRLNAKGMMTLSITVLSEVGIEVVGASGCLVETQVSFMGIVINNLS
jgi:hypothetical protein